ncbi:MAG: hypothetical protein ISEC1_P0617 [Thiomicrorhabdus sp.]|nr:MAG: hypothetical protein ISEC1_P0617 [Thiomicrorhabdus sp.]
MAKPNYAFEKRQKEIAKKKKKEDKRKLKAGLDDSQPQALQNESDTENNTSTNNDTP